MRSLRQQMMELKSMMQLSFDLQLDIQRAIRQEVSAAVSAAIGRQLTGLTGLHKLSDYLETHFRYPDMHSLPEDMVWNIAVRKLYSGM